MKAIKYLLFSLAVLATGCQKDTISVTLFPQDPGIDFRAAEKLLICHSTGSETTPWELIEVTEMAYLMAHLDHGDGRPEHPVPGMPGYTFGCNCEVEIEVLDTRVMLDGRTWTTTNLEVVPYGFENETWWYNNVNSGYGRLYTWEAAGEACQLVGAALGEEWGLPTNEEWNALIAAYDGNNDPNDNNLNAYYALLEGGSSGFDALLGGFWDWEEIRYSLGGSHGYYWSATEHALYPNLYADHVFLASPTPTYIHIPPGSTSKNYGMSCRCIKKLPN